MKTFLLLTGVAALSLLSIIAGVPQTIGSIYEDWRLRGWREWNAKVQAAGDEVSAITLADGIDQFEARAAVERYFFTRVSGCGFPTVGKDAGAYWEFETAVGIAGAPGAPIKITKKSGLITSHGYPDSSVEVLKWERPIQPPETTAPSGRGSS